MKYRFFFPDLSRTYLEVELNTGDKFQLKIGSTATHDPKFDLLLNYREYKVDTSAPVLCGSKII